MDELKSQLGLSQNKLHKQAQDATRRDEQLVVLKVELATLQEKHRLIQEEVYVQCLISEFFYFLVFLFSTFLIFINKVNSLRYPISVRLWAAAHPLFPQSNTNRAKFSLTDEMLG